MDKNLEKIQITSARFKTGITFTGKPIAKINNEINILKKSFLVGEPLHGN